MKKTILIIIGVIGLCVLFIVGAGLLFHFSSKNIEVTEADQNLIVNTTDVIAYFENSESMFDERFEEWEKVKFIDGSTQLTYEYDSPRDTDPYVSSTITWENSESDANSSMLAEWTGMKLGVSIGGVELVEKNTFVTFGDKSKFADLILSESNSEVIGHMMIVKKGTNLYSFIVSGLAIKDKETWKELFNEKLDSLK